VKISLLFEHKSNPEKFTPVQLGGYLFSGFQKQMAQDKEVSPIIPVLLYHGKERRSAAAVAVPNVDGSF